MKPKIKRHFSIFLASPGDVIVERDLIRGFTDEWNRLQGQDKAISLDVKGWDTDLAAVSGVSAQDEIIEQLVEDCDIMIGIFWSRFGSPTDKAASGTIQEIEYFISKKLPVIMYFIDRPVPPSEMDVEALRSIKEFKKKYQSLGIYKETKLDDLNKFRMSLLIDINVNIDYIIKAETANSGGKEPMDEEQNSATEWFEISIKKTIESILLKHDLLLSYKRELTFDENCRLWSATANLKSDHDKSILGNARISAFDKKYGKYNYSKDLREKYKKNWFIPILSMLRDSGFDESKQFNVIGVGANNGIELNQIFEGNNNCELSVLDLSNDAIRFGRSLHGKRIKFYFGNMEECTLASASYDIYLNLRSIHSTGVDIRLTLAECYRILKPGGVAIVSISNGYLLPEVGQYKAEQTETSGMYDNSTKFFSDKRPYYLADKVRNKMDVYGFKNIEMHTGKTEIFIKGIR